MLRPSGSAMYDTDATTRARFDTRPRNKRPTAIAPSGIAAINARRGRMPIRPKTKVPAKAISPKPGMPGVPVPKPLGDQEAKKCRHVVHHESSGASRPIDGRWVATRLREPK